MRKIVGFLLTAVICLSFCQIAAAAEAQKELDYWLARLPEKEQVLLTNQEIMLRNEKIAKNKDSGVYELSLYPQSISGSNLKKMLQAAEMPDGFVGGKAVQKAWSEQVFKRLNLAAVREMNRVEYGLTVERCNMRSLPTATPVFETAEDREFDQLQSTVLNPGEGVIVLQKSGDGMWLFVQATTYRGWVAAASVALVSERQTWLDYLEAKNFIVVTANKLQLEVAGKKVIAEMGTKIPLAEGEKEMLLPQRDNTGKLQLAKVKLPHAAEFSHGYLPYTTENVLRQAFKFNGQPYGWGGLQESVDCSSMIMDIYRCFGFQLPRDADTQESASAGVATALPAAEKARLLDAASPGAELYMPGHTMLYLGKDENRYYIIHSLGSAGAPDKNGKYQRVPVMKVIVSELNMTRKNGKTFFESLTSLRELQK